MQGLYNTILILNYYYNIMQLIQEHFAAIKFIVKFMLNAN